jgi:uncharacterized membrane protein YkoI
MKIKEARYGLMILAVFLAPSFLAPADAYGARLPKPVSEALEREFPGATILSTEREKEDGVDVYEVELKYKGERIEVEFAPDGSIGEIEAKLGMDALPADVQKAVKQATTGASRVRVERHERRGRARNGTFAPLAKPRTRYEVKYTVGRRRMSLWFDADEMTTLPPAAKAALDKEFPKATIAEVELEFEGGVKLYEVELREKGSERDVLVSAKGVIIQVEMEIDRANLPLAVRNTLDALAAGGKIEEIEKVEQRAKTLSGRIVRLKSAIIYYEAEVTKGDKETEVKILSNGKYRAKPKWEERDDDEDDGEDDDDD